MRRGGGGVSWWENERRCFAAVSAHVQQGFADAQSQIERELISSNANSNFTNEDMLNVSSISEQYPLSNALLDDHSSSNSHVQAEIQGEISKEVIEENCNGETQLPRTIAAEICSKIQQLLPENSAHYEFDPPTANSMQSSQIVTSHQLQ